MISLKRRLGLDIFLKKNGELGSKTIKLPNPDIRTFAQIKKVFLHKKTRIKKFYYMYRNVAPNDSLVKYGLRFDITVIPYHRIGDEEIKTTGHYHAHIRKTELTYPEVYEVVHGKAIYLLQKKSGDKIVDVIVARANEGDIIVVPPNYGHITINPSRNTLVMANLVYGKFKSQYREIEEKHGGAYYAIKKNKKIIFIKNPSYKSVPKIRFRRPHIRGIASPIYIDCKNNPEKYLFLVEPQKYKFEI